ncbi:MAG: S41 family peptidase [Rikenellaceae bacterium]
MKRHRIWISLGVVTLSLLSIKASGDDNFGLMQSTETTIKLMRELSENYVDDVEPQQLLKDAAYGMTRMLDPYSAYLAEEDMADFQVMTTGKYGGIGSVIRQKGKYVIIAQPYKDSPAAKSGLRIGDKLLKIDGVSAVGMTTAQASERLKGTPGTKLKIEICPIEDTTTTRKITLTRERIKIPAISYSGWVGEKGDSIGYIRHADFTEDSYKEMSKILLDMRDEGLSGVVLDYRSNGGGLMQESIDILSLFLPKSTEVLKIKGRQDSTVYKTTNSPLFEDLPLVVLIDENSASAAEIVAGALQDMDRAVLIGQRSFGKGLVQSTLPVGYNSYLKLTTARYYIPSGRCIQAIDYSKDKSNRAKLSNEKSADSLKREFTTRSGRKVYDGGGIAPDVVTEPKYISRFAAMLYGMGIIDEFGDEYYIRNLGKEFSAEGFSISDAEYDEFAKFVESRDIPYKSRSRTLLEDLKKAATEERYDTELIEELEQSLKDDKLTNLATYRAEITRYINDDIILRHGFYEDVIKNSLPMDDEVNQAIKLLTTPSEWQRSLEAHSESNTTTAE